jgi:hypothetical protein
MRKTIKLTILLGVVGAACALGPNVRAQQARDVFPAPLPTQIYNAKKVFVSNAGGDSNHLYSGEPERLYNQFYSALKSLGRYDLARSPAEADLVFEISFHNPFIGEYVSGGRGQASASSRSATDPQFRLTIVDPGTRVTLWVFTEHIQPALLQNNRDKNFDQAVNAIVNDLRNVAGQPVATATGKNKLDSQRSRIQAQ